MNLKLRIETKGKRGSKSSAFSFDKSPPPFTTHYTYLMSWFRHCPYFNDKRACCRVGGQEQQPYFTQKKGYGKKSKETSVL